MKNNIQVVKIGASVIIQNGEFRKYVLDEIVHKVKQAWEQSTHSVLVVSGAIKFGMVELGYQQMPNKKDIKALQRCACVGQPRLMSEYLDSLKRYKLIGSQLLVTYHNLDNEEEERNIEERVKDDIAHGIITLVNYNDGIDSKGIELEDEKGIKIRDNDMLAAQIAKYINANKLIMLTNPKENGTMGGRKTKQEAINQAKAAGIEVKVQDYRQKYT
jgi:glutamate 5-kinase